MGLATAVVPKLVAVIIIHSVAEATAELEVVELKRI